MTVIPNRKHFKKVEKLTTNKTGNKCNYAFQMRYYNFIIIIILKTEVFLKVIIETVKLLACM